MSGTPTLRNDSRDGEARERQRLEMNNIAGGRCMAALALVLAIMAASLTGIYPQLRRSLIVTSTKDVVISTSSVMVQIADSSSSGSEGEQDDASSLFLSPTFYESSCPRALEVVNASVSSALSKDPTLAPALLRLFFHDCFVQGCDASVLLAADYDGGEPERNAKPNLNSLRGFEVIDAAKEAVELECPGIVSCADILLLAANQSLIQTGGPSLDLLLGRRDGVTSTKLRAESELPSFKLSVSEMLAMFQNKGFNERDLASLIGAHTIGVANTSTFCHRLNNTSNLEGLDHRLNGSLLFKLDAVCLNSSHNLLQLDPDTPFIFDNNFYKNVLLGWGLLGTDAALIDNDTTSMWVQVYAGDQSRFFEDFKSSMLKMSKLGVLSGRQGEIRRNCALQNNS